MTAQELLDNYANGERLFREAYLSGVNFTSADIRGANLSGANIHDAIR